MQRDRPMKISLSQRLEIRIPIDHPFAQWAIDLTPALARFFPERVLDRDHLDARGDKVERDLPSRAAAFRDRMADVEVISGPLRIELIHRLRDVPELRSDVAFVVMEPALHAALLAQLG